MFISLYPLYASFTSLALLQKAGGSKTTTSNCFFCALYSLNKENTSPHFVSTFLKLFNSIFFFTFVRASSDISTAVTCLATVAAFMENPPLLQKQSRTSLSLQYFLKADLFSFWSKKYPVFCPFLTSTAIFIPFSFIIVQSSMLPYSSPFFSSRPSFERVAISERSYIPFGLKSSTKHSTIKSLLLSIPKEENWTHKTLSYLSTTRPGRLSASENIIL